RLALRSASSLRLQWRDCYAEQLGQGRWNTPGTLELHDRADIRDLVRTPVQHPEQPGHEQRPVKPNRPSISACRWNVVCAWNAGLCAVDHRGRIYEWQPGSQFWSDAPLHVARSTRREVGADW